MTQANPPSVAASRAADYPARWIAFLLIASVCYLAVLSFLNARGLRASPALVAGVEVLLYMVCLGVLIRRLPLLAVAFSFAVFAWLVLT